MDERKIEIVRTVRGFSEFITEKRGRAICELFRHQDALYAGALDRYIPILESERRDLEDEYLEEIGVHIPTEEELRALLASLTEV